MPRARRSLARRAAYVALFVAAGYAGLLVWLSEALVSPPRPSVSESARPVLGVLLKDTDGTAVVERAVPPASSAGLLPGDRIVALDGRAIDRAAQVRDVVASAVDGESLRVEASRPMPDGTTQPVWADIPVDVRPVTPFDAGLNYEDIAFTDDAGRLLRGWYVPPPGGGSAPGVVLAHGNAGDRRQWLGVAWELHRAGFGQVLFDFAGRGTSEGETITLGPREAAGIRAALDAIAARPEIDGSRLVVVGRSMGAVAAMLAAEGDPRIRGLVLDSPFATLADVIDDNLRARGLPPALVRGPLFALVAVRARYEPSTVRPVDVVPRIEAPILLFHGTDDRLVPFEHALRIRDVGGDRVALEPLPDLDHNSPRPDDLAERIARFASAAVR